jgi:hypothetical protein
LLLGEDVPWMECQTIVQSGGNFNQQQVAPHTSPSHPKIKPRQLSTNLSQVPHRGGNPSSDWPVSQWHWLMADKEL